MAATGVARGKIYLARNQQVPIPLGWAINQAGEPSYCGHLMLAMDIAKFQPLEQFTARMEAFVDEIKAVPLAQGFDEVFYPGEIEDRNDVRFRHEGLALPQETTADLRRIVQATGLEALLPDVDGHGEAV